MLAVYRGVNATQPVDTGSSPNLLMGSVSGSQIAFVAPSISPSGAHDHLLVFYVYDSGDGSTWGNVPMSTTALTKLADTGSIALFEGALGGAGATGTVTATASFAPSDAVYGTGLVVALTP